MKHLFTMLALCIALYSVAQKSVERALPIKLSLDLNEATDQDLFHLYFKGDHERIKEHVESNGGRVKSTFKAYSSVVVSAEHLLSLLNSPHIEAVHYNGDKGQPLLAQSLAQSNVYPVHSGSNGLPAAYQGEGVIIGVIDAGLDLNHPDFMNADSTTRVLEYWDQTLSFDVNLTPSYGYGRVYDSAMINAGLSPSVDQASFFGHGTNTTGICASNSNSVANDDFKGVAPKADIIVVSSNFSSFGWTSTVADAVEYIFERAEHYGMPCVINGSLGTYTGSHDAKDIPAQQIDAVITDTTGRAFVCAAGNSGHELPYHLGYQLTGDTHFTWFHLPPSTSIGTGNIFVELYGDQGTFENLSFTFNADQVTGGYQYRGNGSFLTPSTFLNQVVTDTLMSSDGNYLGAIQAYADSSNGVFRFQAYLYNIDSIQYQYGLTATGQGKFDLWTAQWLGGRDMVQTGLPTVNDYPRISAYKMPDNAQSIVSSWACSDKVITVGNYTNRSSYTDIDGQLVTLAGVTQGDLAENSSRGPSRLGVMKPEISAPGDFTLTSGAAFQIANLLSNSATRERVAPGGMHNRAGGTSSASPVVAGVAALYFEKCPGKSWSELKQALTDHPIVDQYTLNLPNNEWGYGKVDALAVLKSSTPRPKILAIDNEYCEGDSLLVSISAPYDSLVWNTGDTNQSIVPEETGVYFATVLDEFGCVGYSDSLAVFERPNPVQPILALGEDTLAACPNEKLSLIIDDTYGAYEWNTGAYTNDINIEEEGWYFCEVTNGFGCTTHSDSVYVFFHPMSGEPKLQLQADGWIYAAIDSATAISSYEWHFNFNPISNADSSHIRVQQVGIYQVMVMDTFSCAYASEELSVYALGLESFNLQSVQVYPTPMLDRLSINAPFVIHQVSIKNNMGQVVYLNHFHQNEVILPTDYLPPGVYTISIEGDGRSVSRKLMK